jgi:hypothetical protein
MGHFLGFQSDSADLRSPTLFDAPQYIGTGYSEKRKAGLLWR